MKGFTHMKKKWVMPSVTGALFALLILLVKTFDVEMVGPKGTAIGLSHINKAVHEFLGENMLWYDITDILGLVAIAVAAVFAVLGAIQLIKRKSIKKVDMKILTLGGLYAVMMLFYVLFEVVIINYRPIIMPDSTEPEAAFPSSHTMLVCVIMCSAVMVMKDYIKNAHLRLALQIVSAVIVAVTVVGRLLSGVHWLTDVFGGVLISITLLSIFKALIEPKSEDQ